MVVVNGRERNGKERENERERERNGQSVGGSLPMAAKVIESQPKSG